MVVYLIVFLISTGLFYIAPRVTDRHLSRLLNLIGLLLPVILAGVRSQDVGWDNNSLVHNLFRVAKGCQSYKSILAIYGTKYEWLHLLLIYILSHTFSSVVFAQLLIHLVICGFTYLSLRELVNKEELWVGELIFYLFCYNVSLSMIRQSMAAAIILYAVLLLRRKKYVFAIILGFLSTGFHSSGFIFFGLLFLYFFASKFGTKILVPSAIFIIILIFNWRDMFKALMSLSIFPSRYTHFVLYNFDSNFLVGMTVVFALGIIIAYLLFRYREDNWSIFQLEYQMIGLAVCIISTWFLMGERLMIYFQFLILPIITNTEEVIVLGGYGGNDERQVNFSNILLLILFTVYWFYIYAYLNSSGTIPYKTI